jgi:hypothetical protein
LWNSGFKKKITLQISGGKTGYGNGDIFFFSSSGSRHYENLKRILGTLEGRWLHKFSQIPEYFKGFSSKGCGALNSHLFFTTENFF